MPVMQKHMLNNYKIKLKTSFKTSELKITRPFFGLALQLEFACLGSGHSVFFVSWSHQPSDEGQGLYSVI